MAPSALREDGVGIPAATLLPQVYEELCCLSRARLARFGPGREMSPVELVHEAYLRVAGRRNDRFASRRHLFFAISRAMRDVLVEQARRRASLKRGGRYAHVPGPAGEPPAAGDGEQLVELALALAKLERESAESAQVVMLGHFVGLTHPEIAALLGLSVATVERRWRASRAWLRRELSSSRPPAGALRPQPGEATAPADCAGRHTGDGEGRTSSPAPRSSSR